MFRLGRLAMEAELLWADDLRRYPALTAEIVAAELVVVLCVASTDEAMAVVEAERRRRDELGILDEAQRR